MKRVPLPREQSNIGSCSSPFGKMSSSAFFRCIRLWLDRGALKPIWIVECTPVDGNVVRNPFQIQKELRAASRAEICSDASAAPGRRLTVRCRVARGYLEITLPENRLDGIGRTRRALTVFAVTVCDAEGIGGNLVSHRAAKAPTLMRRHRKLRNITNRLPAA